jgi:trehalose 6-phosphate phosphatase
MLTLFLSQRKHPSALGKFEQIASASQGKKVVMFLDYDGTLAPIVADPDAAYMSDVVRPPILLLSPAHTTFSWRPDESSRSAHPRPRLTFPPLRCTGPQMRAAVRDVAKHFPTAIVSGRCRDKVHCLRHSSQRRKHLTSSRVRLGACIGHWLICWLSSSFWRARAQVRSFVDLSELYYAGSHGMDIEGPSSNVRSHARALISFD